MAKERITKIAKISSKFERSGNIEHFYPNYILLHDLPCGYNVYGHWLITREKQQR